MKILRFLLLLSALQSCTSQNVDIKLSIYNKSGKTLDSLLVHDVFDKETMYYNVKPGEAIVKTYSENKDKIPKGERGVFTLVAFDKNHFYSMGAGFIGFPTAYLKDEYTFYIYDTYIATKKGFVPDKKDQRQKIEEFIL